MSEKVIDIFELKICDHLFSLRALKEEGLCHNDLKPSNYLMDWPKEEYLDDFNPKNTKLKILLTDFGLVDQNGGTPIYSSPEGLTNERKPGIADMFSLGRLFTFLIMENHKLFYFLAYYTITDTSDLKCLPEIMEKYPMIKLIKDMTQFDPDKRIRIDDVENELTKIEIKIITVVDIDTKLENAESSKLNDLFTEMDSEMKEISKAIDKMEIKMETEIETEIFEFSLSLRCPNHEWAQFWRMLKER